MMAESAAEPPLQRDIARMKQDPRYEEAQYAKLTALGEALSAEDRDLMCEITSHRFLLANSSDPDKAFDHIQRVITWKKSLPTPLHCVTCEDTLSAHSFVPIGWETSHHSPIIYGCPARASSREIDPTVTHIACQLEHCFAHSRSGSRWVWLVDYNGFGWSHAMQGSLAIQFAKLFSAHMPERLHKILMINPPTVFKMLVTAVSPFVDSRTMEKLVPVTGNADSVVDQLQREHFFPEDVCVWVRAVLSSEAKPGDLPPLPAAANSLVLSGLVSKHAFVAETPVE